MIKGILNTITKKLKFDAQYVFSGGFWLLLGHVFSMLAILATSYVFANYIDPQLYGNYRYLMAAAVIVGLFSLTGAGSAITQATAKQIPGSFQYLTTLSLRYGLLTAAVAWTLAGYYFFNDNDLLALGLLVIGALQPLINTTNLIFAKQIGAQQFQKNTFWHGLKSIITTTSIVATALLTGDVLDILLAFLVSNLAANSITFFINKPVKATGKAQELKQFENYAKHTSVQNILTGFASQLDKLLIFQLLGAKELAIYAFATALPDQYKGITRTIDMLILPRFSNHRETSVRESIFHKSRIYIIFLSISAGIYYFAAPYIFQLLYPAYSESVWLSQIYSLGIIFGISSLPLSALKAEMNQNKLYIFNTTASIFQIVSLVCLIPLFGLMGAIISRILYRFFYAVFAYYIYFFKSK